MGSLTNFAENEVLDHILKVGAYSPPATVYLALFTADPTEAGTLTNEADFTGYARKAITFGAASSRKVVQSGQVDYDPCTAGSNVISHFGLMDGDVEGAGNMLAYGAFALSKTVQSGYSPFVATAEVEVQLSTGGVSTTYAHSILDWLFRAQTLTPATNIQVALFSTACSDGSAGTELTGGSYARTTCNGWDTAVGGASANTAAINFPQATGDWSTAVYAALYMDAVYGLYLDVNDLTVLNNEYGRFIAGALDVTLG